MSWFIVAFIAFAVLFIVGGLYYIYKSATKFKLTKGQLERIKKRNEAFDKEEENER
ncbi:DUF2897 family protein [Thalassotalea aquiviva]|uniref:DUF2897 family protein n=1 Tax=Thalassotalea aquiviva TaxID=3242415 RepID=UPI00352A786A